MLTKEQIEQIVQMTIAQMNHQAPGVTPAEGANSGNGWMFDCAEECINAAEAAQKKLAAMSMEARESLIRAMRKAAVDNAEHLAQMAHDETGYGKVPDKIQKILLVANKTPGTEDIVPRVFTGDKGITLVEQAPFGVIGSITPSTNPPGTVINNSISMIAGGNAVVFNPHPSATKCCQETMQKNGAWMVRGADIEKIVKTVLINKDGKYVINRKFVGHDATYIMDQSGVSYTGNPRLVIADVPKEHPFVTVEMLMPVLGCVRCSDVDQAIDWADAASALQAAVKGTKVEIYLSEAFYPAGDEQNLVYCVTGRTVPTGGIPLDVGCVVSNVSTVLNIAQAIEGKPVTEKMVTVGGSVAKPVTVSCAIGTLLSKLLEAAGGAVGDCTYIIGGPLMGAVTDDLSQPVTKTTGGLLAIPKKHPLLAKKTVGPRDAAFASGNQSLLGDVNGIFSCCDCGICTYYACNFGLKPSKAMQQAKAQLQSKGVKPVKEVKYETDGGIDNKRLPTGRLLLRLDLKQYDKDAPMAGFVDTDYVKIPLKMHIGGPDRALAAVGQRVTKGQLIAKPQGMGAIGMNEIMSIPTGMEACDAMLKAAEVELISAGCVCAGKYYIVVAGVVAGSVVATVKDPALEGVPLLLVRKIENGREGDLIVAADQTGQAGMGDHIYMIGSKEAARIFRRGNIPVDVAIVGFIDTYNEEL